MTTELFPEIESEEAETSGSRRMDPELKTIAAILRLLDDLPSAKSQERVMVYLNDRFVSKDT